MGKILPPGTAQRAMLCHRPLCLVSSCSSQVPESPICSISTAIGVGLNHNTGLSGEPGFLAISIPNLSKECFLTEVVK